MLKCTNLAVMGALQFFCVPICTDYLFDLHKKFHVASTYDTNIEH